MADYTGGQTLMGLRGQGGAGNGGRATTPILQKTKAVSYSATTSD